ncbi:hypothetical protein CCHR01_03399 [Colletotrichum chrysophilum]|uniref:Uncharacterized protein n=1 Tax=Colletotrichum chrysophilum TaxID=1836956 RepID=A0AAD9ERG2_9PEZI|nr:hypothetical protein CCHR01_03399 [Colletotrichum chrysophilum]
MSRLGLANGCGLSWPTKRARGFGRGERVWAGQPGGWASESWLSSTRFGDGAVLVGPGPRGEEEDNCHGWRVDFNPKTRVAENLPCHLQGVWTRLEGVKLCQYCGMQPSHPSAPDTGAPRFLSSGRRKAWFDWQPVASLARPFPLLWHVFRSFSPDRRVREAWVRPGIAYPTWRCVIFIVSATSVVNWILESRNYQRQCMAF